MDAISDRVFTESVDSTNDDPSLLTVILDLSPASWLHIKDQITIHDITKSLLVFLNAHLSLNNSNQVAFIASAPSGSRFLYPNPGKQYDEIRTQEGEEDREPSPGLISKEMYRQFRVVDEAVLEELNQCLEGLVDSDIHRSTLSGALSMALTYTNRMSTLDQSISTTTASAINSTTNMKASSTAAAGSGTSTNGTAANSVSLMKSRILIVSANDEDDIKYIPIMNSIFTAQKMKLSIDVAKLGSKNSSYLQQAADATDGIYLHIDDPRAIIQVLATAFFVEPSIRPHIILPTNSNVNYRASCFITGKAVDLGYVCSVCLCIMSVIPDAGKCPACACVFDDRVLAQLKRGPVVMSKKKRKLDKEA